MEMLGINIYDGKPYKPLSIEENLPIVEQWFYKFSSDLTCIDYNFKDLKFALDVDWRPDIKKFKVKIIEGPITEGGVFYLEYSETIEQLKQSIITAVELIQSFKKMTVEEVIAKRIG